MKFSVCVDSVFRNIDFVTAIERSHKAGFENIEFWKWENKDFAAAEKVINEYGMSVVTFCTLNISLVDPDLRTAYLDGLKRSIEVAKRLGTKKLITQVGQGTSAEYVRQKESLIAGLTACKDVLEENDITLLVEPLNTKVDHPGYFLSSSNEAADILRQVNSENVKMLFDIYHQQITEGDICHHIEDVKDVIGHYHIAGNPHRHELYFSELDYNYIISEIRKIDYDGYIGIEYFPTVEPEVGLQWIAENLKI